MKRRVNEMWGRKERKEIRAVISEWGEASGPRMNGCSRGFVRCLPRSSGSGPSTPSRLAASSTAQTGKVRRVGKLILIRPILVGQAPPQNFLSKKTKTGDIVHRVRVHPLRRSRMPDIRQGPKATVREGGDQYLTMSSREDNKL